jgi:hypothetical protein
MGLNAEIVKGLVELAERNNPTVSVKCTVAEAVNMTDLTVRCTPIDGTADILNVELIAEVTPGILVIPTVGSIVTVTFINESTAYVSQFGGIDSMELNGDSFGGLVKVVQLTTKLNNLENKVNTLITTFNAHVHGGVTAGAAVTLVPGALVVGTLTPTVRTDIENILVEHGDGT